MVSVRRQMYFKNNGDKMADDKNKNTDIPSLESQHYFLLAKDIESSTTEEVMKFILERNFMKDRPTEIRLIINSRGGDLEAAFALIDVMEASSIPIWTYGLGCLASAALTIFIAGAGGHRYITKNTSILSHQFSTMTWGKEHELIASRKEIDLVHGRIHDHYKKYTKQTDKVIKEVLMPPHDVFLSAKEAIKYGCADHVMKGL